MIKLRLKYLHLFFLLLSMIPIAVMAQRDGNNWIFGKNAGLDFNSGSPVDFAGAALESNEGCAAISDASGNLLFYSQGQEVFDRTHAVMLNGYGIQGNEYGSSTQGVGIFPVPGMPAMYYLFTLSSRMEPGPGYLRYSVVDMRLNGGLGGVVPASKNTWIRPDGMSEKMILTTGCARSWLLVHSRTKAVFYAFPLNKGAGIGAPVISTLGVSDTDRYSVGEMKISPDGKRIAMANYPREAPTATTTLELYDFDHHTGVVSNYRLIDTLSYTPFNFKGLYTVEFSPDGSKLYAGNFWADLCQYDLSFLPSLPAVLASRYVIHIDSPIGLRRGPDGMMYTTSYNTTQRISRIRNPNAAGAACNFEKDISGLVLSGEARLTFGMRINHIPGPEISTRWEVAICERSTYSYHGSRDYLAYSWNDGDTTLDRVFDKPGTYWLQGNKGDCTEYFDTLVVKRKAADTTFSSRIIPLCNGAPAVVSETGFDDYLWPNGDTINSWRADKLGHYVLTAWRGCTVLRDSLHVVPAKVDTIHYRRDTTICFTAAALIYMPLGYDRYLWDDGSEMYFNTVTPAQDSVTVWCTRLDQCRVEAIHYRLHFVETRPALLPDDTTICAADTLILDVTQPGASFLWSDGNRNPKRQISATGTYWVQLTFSGCTVRDTGHITVKEVPGSIGNDTSVCADQQLILRVEPDKGSYLWQDGSTGREFPVKSTGRYSVRISYDGCSILQDVMVQINNCNACISFFNSFSPNGDGLNDRFKPLLHCPVRHLQLSVYDRWGGELFHSEDNAAAWDGTAKGLNAAPGVYFYLLKIVFDINSGTEELLFKGDVTLIR